MGLPVESGKYAGCRRLVQGKLRQPNMGAVTHQARAYRKHEVNGRGKIFAWVPHKRDVQHEALLA